jgi:hypothetical protein
VRKGNQRERFIADSIALAEKFFHFLVAFKKLVKEPQRKAHGVAELAQEFSIDANLCHALMLYAKDGSYCSGERLICQPS